MKLASWEQEHQADPKPQNEATQQLSPKTEGHHEKA